MNKSVVITLNKNAFHNYLVIEEFEAGLVLLGWEVKSLRSGNVNIRNNYVIFKKSEAFLFGTSFTLSDASFKDDNYNPMRMRKLLMKQSELNSLYGRINCKGYTLVALSLYWKNARCKTRIGLVKGKKQYDKRSDLKNREWQLDRARILKYSRC